MPTSPIFSDEYWMSKALQLAKNGRFTTTPNPNVGCIIVKDNQVIGQGFHQRAGEGHAEVHALAAAGKHAKGATAYVTLEPCAHVGRTGSCADALITAGVTRVVGAMSDPNPLVAGQGFDRIENAGIAVRRDCLANEAFKLNPGFFKRMTAGLPRLRIKLAQSIDGRTAMASGESKWITGPEARQDVQYLRAESCAVITGCDSVLADDPAMTVRLSAQQLQIKAEHQRQPLRVIIDGKGRLSGGENIFQQSGPILIATCNKMLSIDRDAELGDISIWYSESETQVDLKALINHLATLGCNEILIESGARLAAAFVSQQLCDELVIYCAPTILGSQARPLLALDLHYMSEQIRWQWHDVRHLGNDLRLTLIAEN